MHPEESYERRRLGFLEDLESTRKRSASIGRLRVLVFGLLFVIVVLFEGASAPARQALVLAAVGVLAGFAALVVLHYRSRTRERWLEMRILLCEEGVRRIRRDWSDLPELGPPAHPRHPYAADLDLFGHASLARLLGSVTTTPGRLQLRTWLLDPSPGQEAAARQPAVEELARHHDLRESTSAWGRIVGSPTSRSLERLLAWAEAGAPAVPPWARVASYALPALFVVLASAGVAGWVPGTLWLIPVVLALAVTLRLSPALHGTFREVSSGEVGLAHYGRLFEPIEQADFETPALRAIQARLGADGLAASEQLTRLLRLVHLSDARRNAMVYWPLQLVTLWDLHVAARLERWRGAAGGRVRDWVDTLGQVEALCGLATLRHENPGWVWPELTGGDDDVLEARELAHPYLAADVAVGNDVTVGPSGSFLLITGSNMSGKSTLLRAIGVNTVLARAGGPVAARSFRVPELRLETSMRVSDSLEEGVSLFMAELRGLKVVVDAARDSRGGRVLYLLDEILQGTNTAERQIAARQVIRHLLDAGAVGAITTHDLHLADAPDLVERARPVHFRESFRETEEGPTLTFDYRLRPGLATSTNALTLMSLVGLGAPGGHGGSP